MAKWQLFKYHPKFLRVCMDQVDRRQNYQGLYGILQLLQGSRLDNFPQKLLKLVGQVHSLKFQLKCLDFQFNQYKKLAPVLSRFCNGLCIVIFPIPVRNETLENCIPKYKSPRVQQFLKTGSHCVRANAIQFSGSICAIDVRASFCIYSAYTERKKICLLWSQFLVIESQRRVQI